MRSNPSNCTPRKLRNRRAAQNVGLATFSLFIIVIALEVVLRTTHLFGARISWKEPHPILGWTCIPNAEYWNDKENDHPISGRMNSFGWRDRDWTLEKPPRTFRAAIIGDSMVEAMQVEGESTFVALAESELNRNTEHRIELLNFGREGMTQAEEYLVLQQDVIRFSPDVVALFFWPGNDIQEIHRETARNELRPFFEIRGDGGLGLDTAFSSSRGYRIKTLVRPFKVHSALISLIGERYNAFRWTRRQSRAAAREKERAEIGGLMSLYTAHKDSAYVRNYKLCKRLIKAMADFCDENEIAFILVCGSLIYQTDDIAGKRAVDPTFCPDFIDKDLEHWTRSQKIEYLGLHDPFVRFYEKTGRPLTWAHWNYDGHRVVAAELSRKLGPMLRAKGM